MLDFRSKIKIKYLPEISDELLAKMREQIKPVVFNKPENKFRLIDISDIDSREQSFLRDYKLGKRVKIYFYDNVELLTFHNFGYYGFFKPSLAEVYACINAYMSDWSEAKFFYTTLDNLPHLPMVNENLHYARTLVWGDEAMDVVEYDRDGKIITYEEAYGN